MTQSLLLLFLLTGCVFSTQPAPSPGSRPLQAQAIAAYERGCVYMGQGRYLLAREQFSEVVTMAVTQDLYDDAVAGRQKADDILQNRRKRHE